MGHALNEGVLFQEVNNLEDVFPLVRLIFILRTLELLASNSFLFYGVPGIGHIAEFLFSKYSIFLQYPAIERKVRLRVIQPSGR